MEEKIVSRITWLDILKGLGIILVLLGHIYQNDYVFNWIYSFHMPVFFFAAGYIYKKKNIIQDIKRRVQTVLVPYFVFGSIILLYWLLIERKFRESTLSTGDAIIGFFRGSEDSLDFNVHLWFLPCFFLTAVIFNLFMNLVGEKWTYCIVVILSVLFAVIGPNIPSMPWGADRVCKYIAFWAIGYAIHKYRPLKAIKNKGYSVLGMVALFAGAVLSYYFGREGFVWYLNATIGVTGLTIISLVIYENNVLEYLGKSTIVVLCFHGPVYRAIIKALSLVIHIDVERIRTNPGFVSIVMVITILFCMVLFQVIMRFVPQIIGKQRKLIKKEQ